jgi:hypothetical protein
VALAAAVFAPAVVCAFTGWAEPDGFWVLRVVAVMGLAFVGVLGPILAPFRGDLGERLLLAGGLGVAAAFALAWGARLGEYLALESCAQRAEPLVAAIERFQRDRGAPPAALPELVPDYLPLLPGTGLPKAPQFVYERRPNRGTGDASATIPWELRVEWTAPVLEIHVLYYRPHAPDRGTFRGRPARPIGDWFYVVYD